MSPKSFGKIFKLAPKLADNNNDGKDEGKEGNGSAHFILMGDPKTTSTSLSDVFHKQFSIH